MLITDDDIEQVFKFGSPSEVRIRSGDSKFIRIASVTPQKLHFFHDNRLLLTQRGIVHRSKWQGRPGEMEFAWWLDKPVLAQERAHEAVEASRRADTTFDCPMGGGIVLRPYQNAGVELLHKKKGFLLADQPGLGKSLQVVGIVNMNPKMDRILVICPKSVRAVWWKEFNAGLLRKRSVAFAEGNVWPTASIIIIMHYEIAHKFEAQMTGYMWDLAVIDEVQKLRNRKASMTRVILGARANSAKGLPFCGGVQARVKGTLTGTPLVNAPMDLFPFLRWADRDFWGSYTDFERSYALDDEGHKRLNLKLAEWGVVRRLKRDVAKDLPPKTSNLLIVDPHTPAQLKVVAHDRQLLHDREEAIKRSMSEEDFLKDVENNTIKALKIPATELSAIRKATAEALFPDAVEQARELLEGRDKLVIFAHHRDIILGFKEELKDMGAVHFMGGMGSDQLTQNINIFTNDPKCRVFIAAITATGTGVDGLQKACSVALFAEGSWLSTDIEQGESRLDRMGQKMPTEFYHMALEGSIGIRILKVSIDKRRIADRVVDGSDAPAPDAGILEPKVYKPRSIFGRGRQIGSGIQGRLF